VEWVNYFENSNVEPGQPWVAPAAKVLPFSFDIIKRNLKPIHFSDVLRIAVQ
jgi:hypothetical protein